MNCAACDHPNAEGARFCESCGAAQGAATCSSCGASLSPSARFCNQCGTARVEAGARPAIQDPRSYTPRHLADRILRSRSALEGERKQVTVVFADVHGSMQLSEHLDPEEWHATLDRFFEIVTGGVHRFEGTVNQYTGDGIMALFGAPLAHEDHAQRACFAALHLQRELREFADELRLRGQNLSVRIGLNSGAVVVGAIGDDLRMDYTAQGHTVGLAQRAEELAEAGRILLTSHTARLVEGYFELRSLGQTRLRGVSEALELFELEGLGALRTRLDASRASGFTRFVGREAELGELDSALQQALAGDGSVVGVVGEAGVGKSRLCQTFASRARAVGAAVYETRCPSHARALANTASLELGRAFCGVDGRDEPVEARRKIAGTLVLLDERLQDSIPLVFDFLGYRDPARPPESIDPDQLRRRIVSFLRELMRARSEHEAALILVDDLHWVDPESDAFLADLIDAARGTRTLVLTNFRPEYEADWMAGSRYRQLPLRPLGRAESEALLASLLGGDPQLASLRERILDRAGGNPFFAEELVKALAESGALSGAPGAYSPTADAAEVAIPDSVQSLLAARIDRLEETDKRVIGTASVIGRDFARGVLAEVVELPEAELDESLDRLLRLEFVFETELFPEAEYRFNHPLTQSVAYETQLRERRRAVHAAIARALEGRDPERGDERAAEIAQHLDSADEPTEAATWYARAGAHAGLRYAAAAARYWKRVLELTADLPDARPLRLRACVQRLLRSWGGAFSVAEADALLAEGRALARSLGDRAAEMQLESAYALLSLRMGRPRDQFTHLERALALVDANTSEIERVSLEQRYSWTHALFGDARLALEHADEGLAIAGDDPSRDPSVLGYNAICALLSTRALSLAALGRLPEARVAARLCLDSVPEGSDPLTRMLTASSAAEVARIEGDLVSAESLFCRAVEAIQEVEGTWMGPSSDYLLYVRLEREDWQGALDAARLAESAWTEEKPEGVVIPELWRVGRARARLHVDCTSAARREAAAALASAGVDWLRGQDHLERAALMRDLDGPEARTRIEKEIDLAEQNFEERGQRAHRLFVLAERARLAALVEDAPARDARLGEAIELAREIDARGWVARFEAERARKTG